MKKNVFILALATAMILPLTACGKEAQVTSEPVTEEQQIEEQQPEEAPAEEPQEEVVEDTEEVSAEDEIIEFLRNLYGQYGAYLEEGYDAEGNVFSSPITGKAYISPSFTLADANGDNYDDLIVTGELGLRGDVKMSEIMFYDDNEQAFYINSCNGYVNALSEACIIVSNSDKEIDTTVYYDEQIVYKLTPSDDDLSAPTAILAHRTTSEIDSDEVTETYYSEGNEISVEEYNDLYAKYDAAIIPLDYVEMSKDSIDNEVPKF